MSIIGALIGLLEEDGTAGGGIAGTPADYGANLVEWLDAETGVVTSGSDVTSWTGSEGNVFAVPAGQRSPTFIASSQNGLPGLLFEDAISGSGILRRKLSSGAALFDNFFAGSGAKSIAFAGRVDDLTNSFTTLQVIASKGFNDSNGWKLFLETDGTLTFSHRRSNGSVWSVSASGFYNDGDLVLGYLNYDGGNTSGSGSFRLYNQTEFVTTGAVSTGSATGIGSDDTTDLIIGNVVDINNNNTNQPFGGPLFGVWFTDVASNAFDESYMARWIP